WIGMEAADPNEELHLARSRTPFSHEGHAASAMRWWMVHGESTCLRWQIPTHAPVLPFPGRGARFRVRRTCGFAREGRTFAEDLELRRQGAWPPFAHHGARPAMEFASPRRRDHDTLQRRSPALARRRRPG